MNIFESILAHKRQEVESAKRTISLELLREMPIYKRQCFSLQNALRSNDIAIIAEIKKASPSKQIIRDNFDPLSIALEYVAGGASAISVLTDRQFFQGDIRFISDIRSSVPIPILRKDFIIDSYQLTESKAYGADAVLLIAAALERQHLHDLYDEATGLGLECIVEVHNERELGLLDLSKIRIVGINNRNLLNFIVDLTTTLRIASQIPKGVMIVSESGISSRQDIEQLKEYGIHAVLVGESLMRAPSPGKALRTLLTPSEEYIR